MSNYIFFILSLCVILCKCIKYPSLYWVVCSLEAADVTHAAQDKTNKSINQPIKAINQRVS